MSKIRSRHNVSSNVAVFAALAGLTSVTAFAQQAPSASSGAEDELKMEKYVVTGSYIPMAANAVAVPVTQISSADIAATGVQTNALEILRKSVPQFQGNSNIGSNNANISSSGSGGGSQASLRNLTTLTLINGRRAAVSPISGTGGNQFVDLNIIPISAIESIEVLLDGASATYGSDATSGVINIKTKSDYKGAELGGYYQWAGSQDHWSVRGGNFVVGSSNGKTSVTVAGGYSKEDPLFQWERPVSAESYGTPTFGGVINIGSQYFVLNPGLTKPPVLATKPTVSFPMTTATVPMANGVPYFGAVGSNAVYWGKSTNGNITGFTQGELAGATTNEAKKVAFNLAKYVTLLQARESRGAMVSFDHKINSQLTFFGDILASSIDTESQINAQPLSANASATQEDNPFNNTVRVRNRFVTNPRVYQYNTDFVRLVSGLKGDLTDSLSFETAVNLGRSELAYRNPGVIDSAKFLSATGITPENGTHSVNLFQSNVPGSTVAGANFVGVGYNNFKSDLNSWDGRLIWKAASLPAGELTVVGGGEFRKESLSGNADLNSIPDEEGNIGWTGATSVNPFSASRSIWAGFVETLVPVTAPQQAITGLYRTEVGVAVRHERYSDTDDPTVPKLSLRYFPFNDELAVRGTFSKSFNAPTLYQLFGPSDIGYTPEVQLLPKGAADTADNYQIGQANSRSGANPALKPARSTSYSSGLVYSPKAIKGLSVEASYFNISEKDIVGVVSAQEILQDVENNGDASKYVKNKANGSANPNYIGDRNNKYSYNVTLDGFGASAATPISAPGQVATNLDYVYLVRPYVNIAKQDMSGVDFTLKYRWETASAGAFRLMSNVSYVLDYTFDEEQLAGRATITGGTIPRYSTYTSLQWHLGNVGAYAGVRYLPKVSAPDEVTSGKGAAEAYATGDIGVNYEFTATSGFLRYLKGLEVGLSIENLSNTTPPVLPDTFSEANADTGTYSPIGRTYTVKASYKF